MTVAVLKTRFEEELDIIDSYVNLLQDRAVISAKEVTRLIRTLDEFNIKSEKPHIKLVPGSYTADELQSIHDFLQSVQPNLVDAFQEAEADLLSVEEPMRLARTDAASFEGQCIQFVLDALETGKDNLDFEVIKQELREQIRSTAQSYSDGYDEPEDDLVEFAIRSAFYIQALGKAQTLAIAMETADEINANLRMIRRETTVNIFRQGFILLMTIFDATIFDLTRLALKKDFFGLIGSIAKQDKLPFERFANHSSFESLRDDIIEEKLKPKYLKDLLFIINSKGINLDCNPYNFGHTIELVLRRNIHIHNRGFVDERYLERNDRGEEMFNFDHFSVGDFADIDKSYWEKTKTICQDSVQKVCDWVDSL